MTDGYFERARQKELAGDLFEAAHLYRLSADQGIAEAQLMLGLFYQRGVGGLTKDDAQGVRLFRLSADQGNASAQAYLGMACTTGTGGIPKNDAQAAYLFRLSADQGNAMGQVWLAMAYSAGRGVANDDAVAARLFRCRPIRETPWRKPNSDFSIIRLGEASRGMPSKPCVSFGYPPIKATPGGKLILGVCYRDGIGGLAKDAVEAARLFGAAANSGDAAGKANLAALSAQSQDRLPIDGAEIVNRLILSAEKGNARSQSLLGGLYRDGGGGLAKDEARAARLFRLSARQGDVLGAVNLGLFLRYGRGGLTVDHAEAARLFRLAADQGHPAALFQLGLYYLKGEWPGLPSGITKRPPRFSARLSAEQDVIPTAKPISA